MNNSQDKQVQNANNRQIITSKNNPALAEKIKQGSTYFLKVNDQLYKDLANK